MAIIWGETSNNGLFLCHAWKYMSAKLTEFGDSKNETVYKHVMQQKVCIMTESLAT